MSYSSGWHARFSIKVDSDRIYLATSIPLADELIKVNYGILPDSIINTINQLVDTLKFGSPIKSNEADCIDCPVMALKTIIGQDTVRIDQEGGGISPIIGNLIVKLYDFTKNGNHKMFYSVMDWETIRKVMPPPPPPIPPHLLPSKV